MLLHIVCCIMLFSNIMYFVHSIPFSPQKEVIPWNSLQEQMLCSNHNRNKWAGHGGGEPRLPFLLISFYFCSLDEGWSNRKNLWFLHQFPPSFFPLVTSIFNFLGSIQDPKNDWNRSFWSTRREESNTKNQFNRSLFDTWANNISEGKKSKMLFETLNGFFFLHKHDSIVYQMNSNQTDFLKCLLCWMS